MCKAAGKDWFGCRRRAAGPGAAKGSDQARLRTGAGGRGFERGKETKIIMRLTAYIAILLTGCLCVLSVGMGPPKKREVKPTGKSVLLTVFLTGNELGSMKPCGCSGGQLGGLGRRSAVLKNAAKGRRLILDVGSLVAGDGEQDLIKFNVIIRAFELLGYDLVNLTKDDLRLARNLGLLGNMGPDLKVISADEGAVDANVPARFSKQVALDGKKYVVTVASFDMRSGGIEQAEELFGPASDLQDVRILIMRGCEPDKVDSVAKKLGFVDCVVCADDADDRPRVIGDPDRKPLVITAGRVGKYVGRLDITAVNPVRNPRPTASARDEGISNGVKGSLELRFRPMAVTEDLAEDQALARLYEEYQLIVKESGLLERQGRISLVEGLKYAGSASCKACHTYEYEMWSEKRHADAYATLEKVGSAYDPECVVCHSVGMRYESGFGTPEKTPQLKDVGCENCHGPGSEHIETAGEKRTVEPRSECADCHTPDNSADYNGNEAEYFEKIIHWREPNAPGNVKIDKLTTDFADYTDSISDLSYP